MRSSIIVDINAPKQEVATLYADPLNSTAWMEDVERCEPLSGAPGMTGSSYRLVPKRGARTFTATVIKRNLPYELRLRLASSTADVELRVLFTTLPDGRTRMASEEEFRFKKPLSKAFGWFAKPVIHKAHRMQIHTFKQFAERRREQPPPPELGAAPTRS